MAKYILFYELSNSRGQKFVASTTKRIYEILEYHKKEYEEFKKGKRKHRIVYNLFDVPVKIKVLLRVPLIKQ